MQITSLLVALAATFAAANAAECSYSQLTPLSSNPAVAQGNAACADSAVDINALTSSNMKAMCKNTKCIEAVKGVLALVPDCELQGQNLQAAFKKVLATCEAAATSAAPRANGSGASAVTATAVAAAAAIAYGRM